MMLDLLRNLTKSAEEKQQEQIQAYVSDSLAGAEKRQFETQMAQDADLQAEVDSLRQLRQAMRGMPQRRAPRSFALDPAKYGKPQPQRLGQFYPVVRAATALTAVFLVVAIGAEFFTPQGAPVASFPTVQQEAADSVAMGAQDTNDADTSNEAMADDAMTEEMEEEEMVEEMEEEAMADDAAAMSPPLAESELLELPMPENADSLNGNAPDDSGELANTPPPQSTVDTPRIAPIPTLAPRSDLDNDESDDTVEAETTLNLNIDGTAVAELDEDELLQYQSETDRMNDNFTELATEPSTRSSIDVLRLAQIGLAIILVGLFMLLRAARMQR